MQTDLTYHIEPPGPFSLRFSAGPARWGGEASPRQATIGQRFVLVDAGTGTTVSRRVTQDADGLLQVQSTDPADDPAWFSRVFRNGPAKREWADPVIQALDERFPGLWALTDGGLFEGLVTSIVGQSISIASAMAAQRRLAMSFRDSVTIDGRPFVPLPSADHLADASVELIRASGVTWRRAEALREIAREHIAGNLPNEDDDPVTIERELRKLPLVGPWTAASALLWGLGAPDAFPSGDVALLRAARLAYDQDGMTMKDLHTRAEQWRPHRAIATRLLWIALLGPAWEG